MGYFMGYVVSSISPLSPFFLRLVFPLDNFAFLRGVEKAGHIYMLSILFCPVLFTILPDLQYPTLAYYTTTTLHRPYYTHPPITQHNKLHHHLNTKHLTNNIDTFISDVQTASQTVHYLLPTRYPGPSAAPLVPMGLQTARGEEETGENSQDTVYVRIETEKEEERKNRYTVVFETLKFFSGE